VTKKDRAVGENDMDTRRRVAMVTNMVPPYRIPLFNRLAQDPSLELKVIALAETEANRRWRVGKSRMRFDCDVLRGLHGFVLSRDMPVHVNWGVSRALRKHRAEVVITSGYDALAYWRAFFHCRGRHRHFILWCGTTLMSTRSTRGLVALAKTLLIRRAGRYVSYGTKAAEYLVQMGAPKEKVHVGVNTVDMDWYRAKSCAVRAQHSFPAERWKYPSVMFLYVGQLIERKNLELLVKALGTLGDEDTGLFVVGSGPLEDGLRNLCCSQGARNVYFEGFRQQEELPRYYALADVLVLPSTREVWGLVVNEALASGLYVLCSNRAGAGYDLIEEGWNGRLFDPQGVGQLGELIRETKTEIDEIRARREAISEHACREFSIERSARAFLEAIASVTRA
jgi:glycosyltransferase involved in cell wall biosynthesis